MPSPPAQSFAILQAIARRRCASCERWQGARAPGPTADCVAIADEASGGLCSGGPWDGQQRLARSACGRWLLWSAVDGAAAAGAAEVSGNHG